MKTKLKLEMKILKKRILRAKTQRLINGLKSLKDVSRIQ